MKPHGHYCKICGEYKANEKFSGKGHAAHICKKCQSLSAEERSKEATLTRLMNLPFRLSKTQIEWLKGLRHDKRPEISEAAKAVFAERFPNAERNERKGQINIKSLELWVCAEFSDEYGNEFDFCGAFAVDKKSCTVTLTQFDESETVTLNQAAMNKLLKHIVHYYEVFCWEEDYCMEADAEMPAENIFPIWKLHVEYLNGEVQDMQSGEYLPEKVEELVEELLGYFEDETEYEDSDDEDG